MSKPVRRDELADIAARWMAFWQGGSLDGFDEVHAPHFVDHSSSGRSPDRAGLAAGVRELYRAFPDFMAKTDVLVIDEVQQLVTIRWTATGTCREPFMGVPATGQAVDFTGIELIRIADGQVVERWGEWDEGAILAQLRA